MNTISSLCNYMNTVIYKFFFMYSFCVYNPYLSENFLDCGRRLFSTLIALSFLIDWYLIFVCCFLVKKSFSMYPRIQLLYKSVR